MQVEIKIDSTVREPKVIVLTDRMTDEVNEIVRKISETEPAMLAGFREDTVTVLDPEEIYRIYAANGKVFAVTGKAEYTLRMRLYEVEERFRRSSFVRISNSEIVNLKAVRSFDLSLAGTIRVALKNGETAYVSRRYVGKIKEALGM
ncbi:LytTR family transcriptional regulator DNA-binding domain-containing protein [Clostridiales bacterium]|nr:LytTR family transcriptional regulator DNA-binding domain-containing protein [Clostridiales bacterium]